MSLTPPQAYIKLSQVFCPTLQVLFGTQELGTLSKCCAKGLLCPIKALHCM